MSSEIEDKPKTPEPSNEIESSDQTELQQTQPPRPARRNDFPLFILWHSAVVAADKIGPEY